MKISRLGSVASLLLLACGPDNPETGPAKTPTPMPSSTASTNSATPTLSGDRPPAAAKVPVVDTYHGVSVTDDYRWLENGDDAKVKEWSKGENTFARTHLDRAPNRNEIKAQLKSLMGFTSPDWGQLYWLGNRLFAMKFMPPKQQPFIVVMKNATSPETEKVVIDPNAIDATGGTSMDWYVPSLDGKLVGVSLSSGGSESGTLHVFETDTGKERATETIPRVQNGTGGGSMAWLKDGSGFYYTRYPAPGERPAADAGFYQEVWFHKLGADIKTDFPSLTKDLPRIAEIVLETSDDGRFVHASVANGDGGEFDQWMLPVTKDAKADVAKWRKLAALADHVVAVTFAPDGELYLRSKKDAPKGKILKVAPTATLDKATVVVPESDVVIDSVVATKSRVFTVDLVGGPQQVRIFDRAGKAKGMLALEAISSVEGLARLDGDDALIRTASFLHPGAWNLYHDADGKLAKTPLAKKPATSFDDIEVSREMCTSKDGTKVPVNILKKRGTKLDGSNRTLLTGYGGYGVSETPWFNSKTRVWFDRGGIIADANLRGGGEFGEAWHTGGNLTKKQNVFDDFMACGKYLVDAKYTSPDRIAAIGGSNGGLLMGAVITQAPSQFRAVVSEVGIYDMLRVETTPNGAFNVTEFGTVKDKPQFDAMFAYSPYHHVKDGTKYPATLFMTGANDPRVDPYNSRKMVARMQAASPQSTILLRTSDNSGHGIGTPLDERIEEETDVWSFLLEHTEK